LVAGGVYGGVTLPTGATLVGNGASIVGVGKPALYVAPGSANILVSDVVCTSDVSGAVVQLGNNDTTQTLVAQVPAGIDLSRVKVPTHRGKRAFEINATDVVMVDCECHDVYTTNGQDSSGIGILNTPGLISVSGGVYEAGSECVLFGGDTIKLMDIPGGPYISDVSFNGCTFTRPASWQTDGVLRVVKNIFEIKNGRGVEVIDCILENCWKDGQDGYAFMLTPTRGGAVTDVVIDGCTVRNVGGGINLTALDSSGVCQVRTTGIVVTNSTFNISKTLYGGTGRFVLSTAIGSIEVDNVDVVHDGSSFFYGTGLIDSISVANSRFNAGSYGFNLAGGANLSNQAAGVVTLNVSGNTISQAASALKLKIPANTWV
jgi:hypothetical protein